TAAAEHLDKRLSTAIDSHRLASKMGWEVEQVERALKALVPTYLQGKTDRRLAGFGPIYVNTLTDEGRRAVGMWPDRSHHLAALVAALAQAEQDTESEEERSRLRKLRDALGKAPKRITEHVVAGVIAGQIGAL